MSIKKLNEELEKVLNEVADDKVQKIIDNYDPQAIKIHLGEDGFSVLVQDRNSKWQAWVDVWVDEEYKDVNTEWNQYIFYNSDESDILSQALQDDDTIYDYATSEAISALEKKGYIYQDENGKWFKGKNNK